MTMWMGLDGIVLHQINQAEKDKDHIFSPYVKSKNKKKKTNGKTKQTQTQRFREQTGCCQRGMGEGMDIIWKSYNLQVIR